jgi:autotransporter family porin
MFAREVKTKTLVLALSMAMVGSICENAYATDYTSVVVVPDGGSISLVPGDTVTVGGNAAQNVYVNGGGTFNADGATFVNSAQGSSAFGSFGLYVESDGAAHVVRGLIDMSGAWSTGLRTSGANATIDGVNLSISMKGNDSHGALASANSAITLAGSTIRVGGTTSSGVMASGSNATVSLGGVNIVHDGATTTSFSSTAAGAVAQQGGALTLVNSTISTSKDGVSGILVRGVGSFVDVADSTVSTSGVRAAALSMSGGLATITGSVLRADQGPAIFANYLGGDAVTVLLSHGSRVSGDIVGGWQDLSVSADGDVTIDGDVSSDGFRNISLSVANRSVWTGKATNLSSVNLADSLWNLTADSSVAAVTLTGGTIAFVRPSSGTFSTLRAGSLSGNGGVIALNTVLNDGGALSNQHTDRVLVSGDASGSTLLRVTNAGGEGASTVLNQSGLSLANEGISLVQVGGASSANTFQLEGGYIAAGPYQYRLNAYAPTQADRAQRLVGGATAGNKFWDYRLQTAEVDPNGLVPTTPGDDTDPGTFPPVDEGSAGGGGDSSPTRVALVPQAPSYLIYSSALFNYGLDTLGSLHQRLGEIGLQRPGGAGGSDDGGEMFVRGIGSHSHYRSNLDFSQYGYRYEQDSQGIQIGGNWLKLDAAEGSFRAGLAATIGSTRFAPEAADGQSYTKVDTKSIAATVTWQHAGGWYVDGIYAFTGYTGRVYTPERGEAASKLKAWGNGVSLETGYPWRVSDAFAIEPQAAVTWQRIRTRKTIDTDGVAVRFGNPEQTVARVGARAVWTFTGDTDNAWSHLSPFIKVNYLQGWSAGNRVNLSGEDFATGSFGKGMELGFGVTTQLRGNLYAYADVNGRTFIDHGQSGWGGNVGMKWTF